jgi:hypothetical protein
MHIINIFNNKAYNYLGTYVDLKSMIIDFSKYYQLLDSDWI